MPGTYAKDEQRGEGVQAVWRRQHHAHARAPAHHVAGRQDAEARVRRRHADAPAALRRRATGARPPTWQGYSPAAWEMRGPAADRSQRHSRGGGGGTWRYVAADGDAQGGSLRVITTNIRAGYLRKNGVPYSATASIEEYFDRLTYPNGDVILLVRTVVDDPKYLTACRSSPARISSWNPTGRSGTRRLARSTRRWSFRSSVVSGVSRTMQSRLQRFKDAQAQAVSGFESALSEIRAGGKRSHWIWSRLSATLRHGLFGCLAHLRARWCQRGRGGLLRDPLLRSRLLTIASEAVRQLDGSGVTLMRLMGSTIDATKLVSSMTLFEHVAQRLHDVEGLDEYASLAAAAKTLLERAAAEGYPPCQFTLNALANQ